MNLELAASNILKQRELLESKHVAVKCRCLQIWDLLLFFICSSILVLKWRQVSSIKLELQLSQVNLYTRKDSTSKFIYYKRFQTIRNCFFTQKIVFDFEWIKNLMLILILMFKFSFQNSLQSFERLFLICCQRLPIYGHLK